MSKNRIIVEGFWNVGKTSLCEKISNDLGIDYIKEPICEEVVDNVDEFYFKEHELNIDKVSNLDNFIMERSIISSLAFQYAKNVDGFDKIIDKYIPQINLLIEKEVVVVFLYADANFLLKTLESVEDDIVRKLFGDPEFLERYEHFYRVILPFYFGLCPLCIKSHDESLELLDTQTITDTIKTATEEDRIAQVNVVPFIKREDGFKYLVLQRNERKGGFWQTITGGINFKGSLQENVLREIGEELNLNSLNIENLIKTDYSFYYVGGEGYELNEYVFGYELFDDQIKLSDEHVDYSFLEKDSAVEKVKWDGNKEAIRQVDKILINKNI